MSKGVRSQSRRPNILIQQSAMHEKFPGFRFRGQGGLGIWKGELQPRELSPVYTVRIAYRPGVRSWPKVRVLSPTLSKNAPHVYRSGDLCLFWPKDGNWSEEMFLADTIVPWTAEWLMFYELWEETGEWLGPESPHRNPRVPEAA